MTEISKNTNPKFLKPHPGELIPWEKKKSEYSKIKGDEKIFEKVWKDVEKIGNRFIWFCLTDS